MRDQPRVSLVTGGGSGIGRETCFHLAASGDIVVIADINEAEGRETADRIREAGGKAESHCVNVAAEDEVRALFARIRETHGRLEVLVNSAGILRGAYVPLEELEASVVEQVMDVNYLGSFLCCKYAAPLIEESGGGVILLLASGAGVRGGSSSIAYAGSKGAVNGLGMALEQRLAPRGIRVNVVCPGSVDTPMKRENIREAARAQGRDPDRALDGVTLSDTSKVAKVVAFLASDDAAMVRGAVFTR